MEPFLEAVVSFVVIEWMKGERMSAQKQVDLSPYLAGSRAESGGRTANEEESRQAQPQRETRPQREKELFPDYFERKQRECGGRG